MAAAVEAGFRPFFARARDAGQQSLGIAPRDMRVQIVGADVAIVTSTDGRATGVTLHQGGGVFQGTRQQ